MKRISFFTAYRPAIALALGFFDCVHAGHRALISAMEQGADDIGAERALMTFENDMSALFGAPKQIYSFEERAQILEELKIDLLIHAKFDKTLQNMTPNEFFGILTDNFNIKRIYVGSDYTFGKGGEGDINTLRILCAQKGIELVEVPFETRDGEKISSTKLKRLVQSGDIKNLNALLGAPYMMMGEVVHARHVGTELGFPTANIAVSEDKLPIASGIYASTLEIDGKIYRSMTNVGAKPTFGDDVAAIETYIFDFSGDIYGKTVTLRLYERTRDVTKFESAEALRNRLALDEKIIRDILTNFGE